MAKHYQPISRMEQPRYVGVNTFMKLPLVQTTEDIDYAIVGVPDDTGDNFRPGARFGPQGIREQSAFLRPYHMSLGVNVVETLSGVDYGDVNCIPGQIERNMKNTEELLTPLAQAGVIPICLGGDHSITLPELRALAKVHGPLGIVHFDSHIDTWEDFFGEPYNNGTSLRRAHEEGILDTSRSISIGIKGTQYWHDDTRFSKELGIEVITMDEFEEIGIKETLRRIKNKVGTGKTFLTFDIDCVDPAYAPGGGVYEVNGFTSREVMGFLTNLKDIDFVGFDIAEVVPIYDPSGITGFLAASIVHTYLALIALQKLKQEAQ